MNALVEICLDTAMEETGERPDVRRRLSDKILAAFNHAYAVGEYEIATQLKAVLAHSDGPAGPFREMRRSYDPLGEAELWSGFVDARNNYRTACDNRHDAAAVAQALDTMKEAYRRWSQR